MKTLLIVGVLLDEHITKDNPPVEERGQDLLKEFFICLLIQGKDGKVYGHVFDVGPNLYYDITDVDQNSDSVIHFHARSTKGVVIPFEKVDINKSKQGEVVYTGEINKTPMTESIEIQLVPSEKGEFWKGFRWNSLLGYFKQQCSCIVTEVDEESLKEILLDLQLGNSKQFPLVPNKFPPGFFCIRPEDTMAASITRAFHFMISISG